MSASGSVGITIAVRSSNHNKSNLDYYRVPEYWNKKEKLAFLAEKKNVSNIEWEELEPNERNIWLTEGIQPEFTSFIPVGTREVKDSFGRNNNSVFRIYSLGVATNRDSHVYSFDAEQLKGRVKTFIDIYNSCVDTLKRRGLQTDILSLIDTNDPRIKWTRQVKVSLARLQYSDYMEAHIRYCLYRPFTRKKIYFDMFWNEERYQQHLIFPLPISEAENTAICLTGLGAEKPFMAIVTNAIPDYHLVGAGANTQCFPYYTYAADGSNRRENITDWALKQFQQKYGEGVSKWDIFHYVYGMLHHPQYRERYAENLKRDLPHIPLLNSPEAFELCVRIGRQLMDLHLHYEQAREYPLRWVEHENVPFSWRVEKMRLTPDRTALVVNESLTLAGLPPECFAYRLGNRSALEWIIDQYQVSHDKRSGIESDPNPTDDDQQDYIVRLVGRIVTVSVETVRLVGELAAGVGVEDWLG